jgi:hypothetical protein
MASGHVTALKGRTHGRTDQCCTREESPCQLGAVQGRPEDVAQCPLLGNSGRDVLIMSFSASDPKRTLKTGGLCWLLTHSRELTYGGSTQALDNVHQRIEAHEIPPSGQPV